MKSYATLTAYVRVVSLVDNVTTLLLSKKEEPALSSGSTQLAILVVMSSVALLAAIYTIAMIIFNCAKSKDRSVRYTILIIN